MNNAFVNCYISFSFKDNGFEASSFYQPGKDFDNSTSVFLPTLHRVEALYCVSTMRFSLINCI